ncbi:MAG: hypothetical protein O3B13_11455 [Planctomycetota bacterium]|nr:hypothetical protein [Planctomycetota bacterium]MDA1163708.1 hypothetical protein [Planctomycetota bacterium]
MSGIRNVRIGQVDVSCWLLQCVLIASLTVSAFVVNSTALLADEPALRQGEESKVAPAKTESAEPPLSVDILARGSSSRSTLQDALQRLPLNELTPEQLNRVNQVLENRSMFRRLPTISIDADPEVYTHLTHNPESVVGIWRVLGISTFTMEQTGPAVWYGDAGDGSTGTIDVLSRTPTRHLLLCKGKYKSPLLARPIEATAVMHLQTRYEQGENFQPKIVHGLDLFVMFPSHTIDTVARVIAPVSHMIADRNFRELSLFVRFMNVAMERQPGWVEQTVQRIDGIDREQRLELMKLSARVYVAAQSRLEYAQTPSPDRRVEQAGLENLIAPYRVQPASAPGGN